MRQSSFRNCMSRCGTGRSRHPSGRGRSPAGRPRGPLRSVRSRISPCRPAHGRCRFPDRQPGCWTAGSRTSPYAPWWRGRCRLWMYKTGSGPSPVRSGISAVRKWIFHNGVAGGSCDRGCQPAVIHLFHRQVSRQNQSEGGWRQREPENCQHHVELVHGRDP